MILVHHLLKEVIDIELSAGIYYCLYLIEHLVEVDTLGIGYVIEGYLTVDTLNDAHLKH